MCLVRLRLCVSASLWVSLSESVCVRLRNYFSVHLCPFGCLSVCFVPFSYLWVNDSFFCFLCLSESVCAQFRHGILPRIYMYRQGEEGGGGGGR